MRQITNLKTFAFHITRLKFEADFKVKTLLKWGEYQWLKGSLYEKDELEQLRLANKDLMIFIDSEDYWRGMKKTPADFKDKDFWIFSFQEFKPQFIENTQAIEDAKEME